jgi:hypothetical protein
MPEQDRKVRPGPDARSVRTEDGRTLRVPDGWELLPPGDAGLTRRVKAGGPSWTVQEKKGRRTFSRGVLAPADRIAACRAGLEAERKDPAWEKRLEAGRRRRAVAQEAYAEEFEAAVETFLAFDAKHRALGSDVAKAIAAHATPVAWLRHQTTGYDDMRVPRVKGMRREVRRMLAERSRELLAGYRRGVDVDPGLCPLRRALSPKT